MSPLFADAYYFLAFLNPHDAAHKRVIEFAKDLHSDARSQPLFWNFGANVL